GAARSCPAPLFRSTSVVPDCSSAASPLSKTVTPAFLRGTIWRFPWIPPIGVPLTLSREGFACRSLPLFQTGHEPTLPLCRRAVGKSIRHDITARLLLKPVVADRRRGLHCRFDIARLQCLPTLI